MSCHGHLPEAYTKIVCNCGEKITLTGDYLKDSKNIRIHTKKCNRQKQYKELPGLVEIELKTQLINNIEKQYQKVTKQ